MKACRVASLIFLCAVLGACASGLMPAPRASVGDFTDHVLEPLALRVADEKIIEAGAALKVEHTPKATLQTVASLLSDVPWIGKLLNFSAVSRKAQLDADLAWLDSRRIPLKRELLDVFISRTTQDAETFTVCVDGLQRRYLAVDVNKFTRLPDGPGPCEPVQLTTLKKPESRLAF